MEKKLFPEERLELLYNIIKEKKKVHVDELVEKFSISKSTIRMDLSELESRGLIKRTHGGAILQSEITDVDESDILKNNIELDLRMQKNQAEKEAIGKLAASLINDGDTLMIDGGSTTSFVAKHLNTKRGLTIITNSYYMMQDLVALKDAVIYLAGGIVYKENAVLVGDLTNEFVNHFKTEKVILGIDGISVDHGLTVADSRVPAVSSIKRKMIEASTEIIVVCDHTKIGRVCLIPIAPLEKIKYIITDDGVSQEVIDAFNAKGVEVLVAHTKE